MKKRREHERPRGMLDERDPRVSPFGLDHRIDLAGRVRSERISEEVREEKDRREPATQKEPCPIRGNGSYDDACIDPPPDPFREIKAPNRPDGGGNCRAR